MSRIKSTRSHHRSIIVVACIDKHKESCRNCFTHHYARIITAPVNYGPKEEGKTVDGPSISDPDSKARARHSRPLTLNGSSPEQRAPWLVLHTESCFQLSMLIGISIPTPGAWYRGTGHDS